MELMKPTSHPADPSGGPGAKIHPLRPGRKAAGPADASEPKPKPTFEEAGELVAQAMSTLLRAQLGDRARTTCATRGLASSFELARMIDTFLSIRDAERRRYCLAVLRSCLMADVEERGRAR